MSFDTEEGDVHRVCEQSIAIPNHTRDKGNRPKGKFCERHPQELAYQAFQEVRGWVQEIASLGAGTQDPDRETA